MPVSLLKDALRAVVAGPTSLREFLMTGGAYNDVESRSRHSQAANSQFQSWAQLPRTPALQLEPAKQVFCVTLSVPDYVRQVTKGASQGSYASLYQPEGGFQMLIAV